MSQQAAGHQRPRAAAVDASRRGRGVRLDQALVERGLSESREKAKRQVLAGLVEVNGRPAGKPGTRIQAGDVLRLKEQDRYVSRGGWKLERALEGFGLNVVGQTVIDLGASTGGFTDCLLQRGARCVYAVDVGLGQLAWRLRQDARVVVMERTNARYLTAASFPAGFTPVPLVTIDCSFISLRQVIPVGVALLASHGKIIALVKPQFEAGKAEVDRGEGVIRDPQVHLRVLSELASFVGTLPGVTWRGVLESPLLGPAGNKEFLALMEKHG